MSFLKNMSLCSYVLKTCPYVFFKKHVLMSSKQKTCPHVQHLDLVI